MACTLLSMPQAPHELSSAQQFLPLLPQEPHNQSQQPRLSRASSRRSRSSATTSTLSFLSLPPELRNAIYTEVLLTPEPIVLPYAYEKRRFQEPALLSACRTIRAEATPIFYGANVFEAPSPAAAYAWLAKLEREKIALLRELRPVDLCLPVVRTAAMVAEVLGEDFSSSENAESTARPSTSSGPSSSSDAANLQTTNTARSPSPPPAALFSTSVPSINQAEIHRRWFSALRANINKLASYCGKGALQPEAICVPVRRSWDGEKVWLRIVDIEGFAVVREPQQAGRSGGGWQLEWRDEDGQMLV
jgi:hypothetical protein